MDMAGSEIFLIDGVTRHGGRELEFFTLRGVEALDRVDDHGRIMIETVNDCLRVEWLEADLTELVASGLFSFIRPVDGWDPYRCLPVFAL